MQHGLDIFRLYTFHRKYNFDVERVEDMDAN